MSENKDQYFGNDWDKEDPLANIARWAKEHNAMNQSEKGKQATKKIAAVMADHYETPEHKDDIKDAVVDMLTDLRHFCDSQDPILDFRDLDRIAYGHYTEEK